MFEGLPEEMEEMRLERQPWIDFEDVWNPAYFQFYERETSGIRNDRYTEQIYIELEHMIEDVIAKPHQERGYQEIQKGETKLWQVLDDKGFDRDQIEKVQSSIRAPSPKELDEYKLKHSAHLQMPINNANVQKWRDDPKSWEQADFDFEQLMQKKSDTKTFYLDRYEKPKELAQN